MTGDVSIDQPHGEVLTCDDGCDSVWNHRPKLNFVGIFGKVEVLNDSR